MDQFRRLMQAVLLSGVLAGLLLFVAQHIAVEPLLVKAETYETAARQAMPGMAEDEGWQPAEGFERTGLTALSTVLTGIGFAAVLFGAAATAGASLDLRRGILLGAAGFACLTLAPALGLPPLPPGAAVADLHSRQIWWAATAVATAIGLWLIFGRERPWLLRCAGVVFLVLPHIIGAPVATGPNFVPIDLVHRFSLASVSTDGIFWILLGAIGGFIYGRDSADRDAVPSH